MDRKLLNKYFQDQCTEEELEEVLEWLQTDEGQQYLEQDIHQMDEAMMEEGELSFYPEVATERIFNRIQISKNQRQKKDSWLSVRVASILLLATALSSLLYWGGITAMDDENSEPAYTTYITEPNQQKVITLSDNTRIRLNNGAKLVVPERLNTKKRQVELKGEAYFEVAPDEERPFTVKTTGSVVEVLGTKFNVKADSTADNVQVAVLEGKVVLKSGTSENAASAQLTQNNFGMLRLVDHQITIEKVNTENFISWVNKRLVFSGETLQQVSRQLERLYDVEVAFADNQLKQLELTADIEKIDLDEVLTTISNTFDIRFRMEGTQVVWMK
jgi:ferric-dicitrate binding protein FerR (iron transport regulator)